MLGRVIDESTEFGQRVARRLREELVIWLTTVRRSGMPLPTPVWFWWEGGDSVLIYSMPGAKVRNLAASSRVSLNFDTDGNGEDIVVFDGTAVEAPDAPTADAHPEYAAKYAEAIPGIGMTPESFAAEYRVPIRVTITGVHGF